MVHLLHIKEMINDLSHSSILSLNFDVTPHIYLRSHFLTIIVLFFLVKCNNLSKKYDKQTCGVNLILIGL